MDTKMAPSYATLVTGYIEELLYQNMEDKYGADFGIVLSFGH